MKFTVFTLFFLFSLSSSAIVNMKNANYSDNWLDIKVPGTGYDLKISRTYNSRTLFNGLFGFGWCSDFETTLSVTPEGNIRIKECGGGLEQVYTHSKFKYGSVDSTINKIIRAMKKKKSLAKSDETRLRGEMEYDEAVRETYAQRYNIKGKIRKGSVYYSKGRKNEKVKLDKNYYVRSLPNGTSEKYNLRGQLIFKYDKNGNYIKLSYKGKKLISIADNNARKLNIKYKTGSNKVKSITGPNGVFANYKYDGEDLVYTKNNWKNIFSYKYDDYHNLVRINYPDKTFKKITYDEDRDWVTSFTDRKKCKETYTYTSNPKDKKRHYYSEVKKVCGSKIVNNSKYEFVHKTKKDGSTYLFRARSEVNGRINDTIFDSQFGKPLTVIRDQYKTAYRYYSNGFLWKKLEPFKTQAYAYKNSCSKVSKIKTEYFQPNTSKKIARKTASKKVSRKKLIKRIVTDFKYEAKKCNLIFAKNSIGQTVNLSYDRRGRISRIKDQAKKIVNISYDPKFGKPAVITRPGLGSLRVKYQANGTIAKNGVQSKEGAAVALQVANIFNNLLEIISPATSDLSI